MVSNAPFLYPVKTSENLTVFWSFQGVEKGYIWNKWVNSLYVSNFIFLNAVIPFNSSWRTSLSYRNQSIDLLSKSMDWFLYDEDVRHEGLRAMFPSQKTHCVNYARIWIFSDLYFPVWGRNHRFYVSERWYLTSYIRQYQFMK